MIGIVLVAYGKLAQGFLASLEDVVGPQQQIETVSIEYRADDKRPEMKSSRRSIEPILATE